jgi:hypothetical protein
MMDGRKVRFSSYIRDREMPNERPGEASRENGGGDDGDGSEAEEGEEGEGGARAGG